MKLTDKTAGSQTESISFEFDFKSDQKQESGGARYGWKMMRGKLVDLLARIP